MKKKQLEEKYKIQEKKLHAHQEELLHIENKNLILYEKLSKEQALAEKITPQNPVYWEEAQSPLLKSILRRAYVSDPTWFDNIRKQGG